MTQAIQSEIDTHNQRQARITNLTSNMSAKSESKLRAVRHEFEVQLARHYGNRLDPMMAKHLVEGVVEVPAVIGAVFGEVDELPKTEGEWREFCRRQIESDELAVRSIEFNDEKEKMRIREDVLNSLAPATRMSMARSGELDDFLDHQVMQSLDRGSP